MVMVPLIAAAALISSGWRILDPAQTLLIDTGKGRIVVEMRPDLAPKSVERVKQLAREGVYDGLLCHRVIDGFVAQTGNPNNKDGGVSSHPDLPAEFQARLPAATPVKIVAKASDAVYGLLGATPIQAVPLKTRRPLRVWGLYCAGVVGMGRQAAPDSANSEIFFMREASRRLDRDYAVWGRVVIGLDVVRALSVGEPPADPDRMVYVRVAADLPPSERPVVQATDEHGAAFARRLAALRKAKGADFSPCDIEIEGRIVSGG